MREEHLVQGFPKILEEMKAVGHLGRCGRPVPGALGIGGRAIPRDNLDTWMLPQSLRHRLPALQIDEHRAVGVAFVQGEIVHPQHSGRGQNGPRQPAQPAQQGVPAHGEVPLVAQTHPGRAPIIRGGFLAY